MIPPSVVNLLGGGWGKINQRNLLMHKCGVEKLALTHMCTPVIISPSRLNDHLLYIHTVHGLR